MSLPFTAKNAGNTERRTTEANPSSVFRPSSERGRLHPGAWLAWAGAAGVGALLIRNPLYLTLSGLAVGVVWAAQRQADQTALLSGRGLARLVATVLAFSTALNMLFSHSGRTVLFHLPSGLPYIGGPVTLEAGVYGLTTGLAIVTLLIVFIVVNAAVEPAEMLRYLPGFLYSAGLVATIALTFAPQTRRALVEIHEAQQVRGHRPRGLRDLPPLVVPLITTGLENALGLAEAMTARGFGQTALQPAHALRLRVGLALASLGLFLGLMAYGFRTALGPFALGLVSISGAALVGLLWWGGQGARRSRYRQHPWHRTDTFVAGASAIFLAVLAVLYRVAPAQLAYDPYPRALPPPFAPLVGIAIVLLTAPIVKAKDRRRQGPSEINHDSL